MAEKQTNKDRMREIVDSIENGIKELFESDKYRKYLATMSRFHRYSVNNTMLIYMQRPDATQVTFIPTESGGMTYEAVITSCGGTAASHLQITILKSNISKICYRRIRL